MVDMSHTNSQRTSDGESRYARRAAGQLEHDDRHPMGVMIESHPTEGCQALRDPGDLEFTISITDACLGWEDSVSCLEKLEHAVSARVRR